MPEQRSRSQYVSSVWKCALVGGGASLPFTFLSYWQTGSELSLSPVLFGGILAGYLAVRNLDRSSGVGVRAGIVGSVPMVWLLFDVLAVTSGLAGPAWFVAGGTAMGVSFVVLGVGFAALVGELGAKVGAWLARKTTDRPRTGANRA